MTSYNLRMKRGRKRGDPILYCPSSSLPKRRFPANWEFEKSGGGRERGKRQRQEEASILLSFPAIHNTILLSSFCSKRRPSLHARKDALQLPTWKVKILFLFF